MRHNITDRGFNVVKSWFYRGFLLLSILFTLGVGEMWAQCSEGQVFYFKPSSNWATNDARFAVCFQDVYGNSSYESWYSCIEVPGASGIYYAVAPAACYKFFFCRMKKSDSNNNWNNPPKWNQSSQLSWDGTNHYNYFKKQNSSWDGDCDWDKYSPPMASATLSNTSTVYGGDGTSGNPYQIKIGTTLSVSASATSSVPADAQTKYFKFYKKEGAGSSAAWGSESTTTTKSLTASSTAGTTYEIYVEARNEYYSTYGTKATSSKIYFITVDPIYAILGGFNSWTHSASTWDLIDQGSNNWDATFALAANTTYEFKVVYNSVYYGKGTSSYTTITRDAASVNSLTSGDGIYNLKITTDVAGNYKFRFNSSTKNLTVTYPTRYTVSYSVSPSGAAGAITTSPSVSSGSYVAKGTSVTFTHASANTGYTWYRWENGSGSSLGTGSTYTTTINANTTVVAKYTENSYTVTVTKNPSAGGSVTPTSATSMGQVNGGDITASANSGYTFTNWTITSGTGYFGTSGTSTSTTTANTKFRPTAAATIQANFTANLYSITFDKQSGSGGTASAKVHFNNNDFTVSPVVMPTRTGYTLGGYYTSTGGGGVQIVNASGAWQSNKASYLDASGHWIYANNKTVYAKWTAKTTSITLNQTGCKVAGSVTSRTGTYDSAMPAITGSGSLPTAPDGYAFMGYWDDENGEGTQYYNADGTSAHAWDKEDADATLYAYFKKAQITAITLNHGAFEPVPSASGVDDQDYVVANPTIAPTPVGSRIVCWEMLYDNDDPVTGHTASAYTEGGAKPDQVRFSIVGLAPGSYKIRATLRTGSSCGGGTILHTYNQTFTIASDFTVTVQYKCGDVVIQASTTVEGKPLTWTEVTAPSIVGYTFSKWKAGEGVTIQGADANGEKASATINFKANYDGKLTAIYTRKRMIYFYNSLSWGSVNVYFYSGAYWDGSKGTGAKTGGSYTGKYGAMTQIAGTNIWYYDCEANSVSADYTTVSFTEASQNGYEFFSYKSGTTPNKVVYRSDYNSNLPMFVPINITGTKMNSNQALYYNTGYWMNYPENTGYTLRIYNTWDANNATGAAREYPFPYSEDKKLPSKVNVEFNFTGQAWFMIYRNDGQLLGKNYTMKQDYHKTELDVGSSNKIEIKTSAPGVYKFTLSYLDCSGTYKYYVYVEYPVGLGDYRIRYNDRAAWSGAAHTATWSHTSDIIRKNTGSEEKSDTVSLYVAYGSTPSAKFQKVTAIDNNTGAVTWADVASGTVSLSSITEKGVYNFIVSQPAGGASISLTKTEKYTGNFYIRTDNAGSTKWDNFRAFDHQMTYTEFSMSDANTTDVTKKYSHYFASWCERSTNIKFCVANDYSSCISDTLAQDVGNPYKNTDAGGTLKTDGAALPINDRYSSNVRFMYNQETNKISRAYVASATNPDRLFLVLRAESEIQDESREPYEAQDIANAVILLDKENWMYEEILYITPGTKFKLFASYALKDPYRMDSVQYFRGAYYSGDNKTTCTFNGSNSVILIDGSGGMQKARVIYDFKTNRLIAAWIPDGTDIDDPLGINADVLIEREHQEAAEYVTFSDDGKLTGVKTVYGAMRFNRWILNNRSNPYDYNVRHAKTAEQLATYHAPLPVGQQKSIYERSLYFISFPFDVRVSEIFGFGRYWDEWYLEYYDGETRAKTGFWIDSPPNWKYVTPAMASTYVLKANVGYILGLDLDFMQADNFDFWSNGISTVELFFPSTTTIGNLKEITEVVIPALSSDYKCTINRTGIDGDRRVKDSYWRCIGTPSLNIYNTAVKDDSGNTISWKTDYTWHSDESEFPFIYRWNMADNTITPQSTSSFTFLPMHSYLVQNGNAIHWSNVSGPSASIVARRAKKEDYREYNWRLALMSDTTLVDQTYVRMSELEQVTDSFDFGQDMSKDFNKYRSDLYTISNEVRLAANSMPLNTESTTIVPVGVQIYKAGEFTLSMPDGTYGVSITLVDDYNGTRTELGAGFTYTFEAEEGLFDNRFHLEIAKVKGTATGIENGDATNSENGVRKVMIDGILYIVRDNVLYDARGARVK